MRLTNMQGAEVELGCILLIYRLKMVIERLATAPGIQTWGAVSNRIQRCAIIKKTRNDDYACAKANIVCSMIEKSNVAWFALNKPSEVPCEAILTLIMPVDVDDKVDGTGDIVSRH